MELNCCQVFVCIFDLCATGNLTILTLFSLCWVRAINDDNGRNWNELWIMPIIYNLFQRDGNVNANDDEFLIENNPIVSTE